MEIGRDEVVQEEGGAIQYTQFPLTLHSVKCSQIDRQPPVLQLGKVGCAVREVGPDKISRIWGDDVHPVSK
jgi:hypothetical protein